MVAGLDAQLSPFFRADADAAAGKVEFRTDKTALVHVPVGKLSFPPQKLIDNATTVINSVVRAKPYPR